MPLWRRLCQEANHSSRRIAHNGLWITDDVLSDAYNRFLRYSHGAKRYGSNVPGPLEAQRRLARRRMVGLAGVGAAPAVDPAALFGMGGPKLGDMVWQPPKSQKDANGGIANTSWLERALGLKPFPTPIPEPPSLSSCQLKKSPLVRKIPSSSTELDTWLDLRERIKSASVGEMAELATEALWQGLEHADFCERAFRSVLWDREIKWEHIMEFLLNPALNVAESRHLTYLVSQLGKRFLTMEEFEAIKKLVEGCLKLGLVSADEIPELINAAFQSVKVVSRSITADSGSVGPADSPESLIEAIWRGLVACRVRTTPPHIAELILEQLPQGRSLQTFRFQLYQHAYPVPGPADSEHRTAVCLATWAVHACSLTSSSKMSVSVLVDILEDLHPTLVSEKILVNATMLLLDKIFSHGLSIESAQDRDTVINGWLLCLHKALAYRVWNAVLTVISPITDISPLDLTAFFARLAPTHLIAEALLLRWLPWLPAYRTYHTTLKEQSLHYEESAEPHRATQIANVIDMKGVLEDYRFLHQEGHSPFPYDAFAYLLIALHRRHQITIVNQQLILEFCERLFGVAAVAQVCDHARAAGVYLHPPPIADVISRIAVQQPRVALSLYKSRKIHISNMPDFLRALIEDGTQSLEIFKILSFPDPKHYLPIEKRENEFNALTQERIDLIHDCADAFSKQEQSSVRTQFRDVYLCYRYLRTRRAPINPLMSRALVRAGITNYLTKGVNVGQRQVKWVLNIVEAIEGEEVAQQLDELVWRWLEKVYAAWNKQRGSRRRRIVPMPDVRLRRGKDGTLKDAQPFAWQRDQAIIPRRIRWYLNDGTYAHTDIDAVFGKRWQYLIKGLIPHGQWKTEIAESSGNDNTISWTPIEGFEVAFHDVIDGDVEDFKAEQREEV